MSLQMTHYKAVGDGHIVSMVPILPCLSITRDFSDPSDISRISIFVMFAGSIRPGRTELEQVLRSAVKRLYGPTFWVFEYSFSLNCELNGMDPTRLPEWTFVAFPWRH